jgi:hypothetical protein
MTATVRKASLLLLLLGLILGLSNCIMEDRTVELVFSDSTCVDFSQFDATATFHSDPVQVWYKDELDKILQNNDVSPDDIVAIKLVSASYGVDSVTYFAQQHDWTISGLITVERIDEGEGPVPLLKYMTQSVLGALNKTIPAQLDSVGVGLIDSAFVDFINGGNPILEFQVVNSTVSPLPSQSDPIVFDWKACIWVDFVMKTDLEVIDPF